MRISDWSSDVCSSDLIKLPTDAFQDTHDLQRLLLNQTSDGVTGGDRPKPRLDTEVGDADRPRAAGDNAAPGRSEEHTSELQSLMRISYDVFCMKKKKVHKVI